MTNDPTVLIQEADGTNLSVYTFPLAGSVTPTAGRVVIVAFYKSATALRTVDSVSTTIGDLSLTHVRSRTFRTVGTPTARIDVYRGLVGASPTAGTVTIDYSGACSYGFCIMAELPADAESGGVNGASAIAQSADNAADNPTGLTVTMGALGAAANALLGIFACDDNIALAPGDSDEEHAEVQHTDNGTMQLTWRNVHGGDTTIATVGGTAEDFGGIALEIVAAAVGGGGVVGPLIGGRLTRNRLVGSARLVA